MANRTIQVLDHGYATLRNLAGPTRRPDMEFDADDIDIPNVARTSFDAADQGRAREKDLRLSRYLYLNKHLTPFEMVECWLEMRLPIFVARQFVRHRTVSLNEVSARYTKLERLHYIPDLDTIGHQPPNVKQGRIIDGTVHELAGQFREELRLHCEYGFTQYETYFDAGIPAELARTFLSLNVYTKWIWKQDLRNLMHFMGLRIDGHAQYESRELAGAVHKLVSRHLPHTMAIFDELVDRKRIALDHAEYLETNHEGGVGRRELEIAALLRGL